MGEHCRLIMEEDYDGMVEAMDKLEKENAELSRKALQLEKKLELCKASMQTIIDNSDEFATKQLLSGVLEKVR